MKQEHDGKVINVETIKERKVENIKKQKNLKINVWQREEEKDSL